VATDRVSAFDVVLPAGIPNKGRVLNLLSAFWFEKTKHIILNHMIEVVDDAGKLNSYLPADSQIKFPVYLAGRSMVVRKAERLPIECVVRGYLSGSAWSEYKKQGAACGIPLLKGLLENQELPEPTFTPTTKAEAGHDLPLSQKQVADIVGAERAKEIKAKSIAVYDFARSYARARGFIIADTKMEFGLDGDNLMLIDELLTPDSSRFWDAEKYKVGQPQDSFDKQPLRDWLEKIGWNKEPPGPELPPNIVASTSRRYRQAYERLTEKSLS
jgi:phosphoribosylaminoimidazole-succinocarboxamide synthase